MTFDEFITIGWKDHAANAEGVFARLPEGIGLISEPRHLPAFAALGLHVAGEHLGRWSDGISLLEEIARLSLFDPASPEGKAVIRSMAILHRCAGNHGEEARRFEESRNGGDVPEESDRIRVLAAAACAFLGQGRLNDARRDFDEAVTLASYGPTAADPAARALAVAGNNLACELEDRPFLTDDERAMMLRAARVGREFWGIAGGWMETERAEYRLAMSHIKAGDATTALLHAERCLAIVEENGTDAGEAFFAHEAVSRASLSAGAVARAREERKRMAALLPTVAHESLRNFCAEELEKLDALLVEG